MKAKQTGFTLVELIVVIVLLGVLAAVAIPRYANNTQQARAGVLNGVAASIRSAALQAQGLYQVARATNATASSVTLRDGTTVTVTTSATTGGIPIVGAGGIQNAIGSIGPTNAVDYDPTTGRFFFTAVGNVATCALVYTTPGTAANPYAIAINSSTC